MGRNIAVVDFVATDGRHVKFNSSILLALKQTKLERLLFTCSQSHISSIRDIVDQPFFCHERFYPVGKGRGAKLRSLLKCFRAAKHILKLAWLRGVESVLILESDAYSIAAIQLLLSWRLLPVKLHIVCLHHGSLHQWMNSQDAIWFYPSWRGYLDSLNALAGRGVRHLVLEQHIQDRLTTRMPGLIGHVEVMPHPVTIESLPEYCDDVNESGLHIGFFGAGTRDKGFSEFLALAADKELTNVGFYAYCVDTHEIYKNSVLDLMHLKRPPERPLSGEEYTRFLIGVDFVFLDLRSDYYALAASGILTDALSMGVPVITLDCAYVQCIEMEYGSIGYKFDDMVALRDALASGSLSKDRRVVVRQASHAFTIDRCRAKTSIRLAKALDLYE